MAISEQQLKIQLKAAGIKTTKAQLKSLHGQVNQTSKGFASMAGTIAAATAGLYAASRTIGSVIKVGKEFEQSMANVKAISGATGASFEALEQNAKALGASTVFTASQVAELQTEFAKLGFTASEITAVTADTLALSSAVGSDLATSAAVAGTTLRGFNMDVSETSVVTDTMALSFSRSALDMAKFTDSMSYVAPIANMAGFSMQETTAVLGTLANSGISGSMAGTALRRIFLELSNESSKLTKRLGGPIKTMDELIPAFEKLKEEGVSTAEMKDLVGQRAVSAFSILLDGVGTLDELTDAFNESGGAAQKMADIQLDTLEGKLKLAKSAMDGLKITMFEMNEEALKGLVEGFTDFITAIDEEDIKAYTASFKILIGSFALYKTNVILAAIATDGFSKALTRTGIGAMVVALGIAIAELLKFYEVFSDTDDIDSNTKAIKEHADAIERDQKLLENYKKKVNDFTLEDVNKELSENDTWLENTKSQLADLQGDLKKTNLSYEDWVSSLESGVEITPELEKQHKEHLKFYKDLNMALPEGRENIQGYVEWLYKENGALSSGLVSRADYNKSQKEGLESTKNQIKTTEDLIAFIESEIKILNKKKIAIEAANDAARRQSEADFLAAEEEAYERNINTIHKWLSERSLSKRQALDLE